MKHGAKSKSPCRRALLNATVEEPEVVETEETEVEPVEPPCSEWSLRTLQLWARMNLSLAEFIEREKHVPPFPFRIVRTPVRRTVREDYAMIA
jgi:hypothetical protein